MWAGLSSTRLLCALLLSALVSVTGCGPGASDYEYKIAGDYRVSRANSIDISARSSAAQGDRQVIPPKVTKIAWNDRYVIAEQQWLKYKDPDRPFAVGEPQDLFYYWVVDTQLAKAFGPYDKPAFELKRKELNLP